MRRLIVTKDVTEEGDWLGDCHDAVHGGVQSAVVGEDALERECIAERISPGPITPLSFMPFLKVTVCPTLSLLVPSHRLCCPVPRSPQPVLVISCSHYGEADGRFLPAERNILFLLSAHRPQPSLSLHKGLVFKQIWTQLSSAALRIEVRVEDAHLRDTVHRKLTAPCGLPDGFRGGRIIDAKGLLFVLADIGMDPGHLVLHIVAHDCSTDLCPSLIHGKN